MPFDPSSGGAAPRLLETLMQQDPHLQEMGQSTEIVRDSNERPGVGIITQVPPEGSTYAEAYIAMNDMQLALDSQDVTRQSAKRKALEELEEKSVGHSDETEAGVDERHIPSKRPRHDSHSDPHAVARFQQMPNSAEGEAAATLASKQGNSESKTAMDSTTPTNTPPTNKDDLPSILTSSLAHQRPVPRPRGGRVLQIATLTEASTSSPAQPSTLRPPLDQAVSTLHVDPRSKPRQPPELAIPIPHTVPPHTVPLPSTPPDPSSKPDGPNRAAPSSSRSSSSASPTPGPSRKDKGKDREVPVPNIEIENSVPSDDNGLRSDIRSLGNLVKGLGIAMTALVDQQKTFVEKIDHYTETLTQARGKKGTRTRANRKDADENAMLVDEEAEAQRSEVDGDADDEEEGAPPARPSGRKAYKRTSFPRRRSPERNALQSAVRELTMAYLHRKHAKAPFDLDKVPTQDEAQKYAEDGEDEPCCTIEDFRPDLNGTAASPWNKSVTEVFVEGYLEHGRYPCDDTELIRKCFYRHLKYLITKFKERHTENDVVKAQLKRKRRRERRGYLFQRRLLAAYTEPGLQRHIAMLERLGPQAMSSDESAPEKGVRQFRILKKDWRNPQLTEWLRIFDGIAREYRINPITESAQGADPRHRFSSGKVDNSRPPVARLPRNAYNDAWISSLTEHMRKRLQIEDKNYDFSHASELKVRANEASGQHVPRRTLRFR